MKQNNLGSLLAKAGALLLAFMPAWWLPVAAAAVPGRGLPKAPDNTFFAPMGTIQMVALVGVCIWLALQERKKKKNTPPQKPPAETPKNNNDDSANP